jgi:hypothetical protein
MDKTPAAATPLHRIRDSLAIVQSRVSIVEARARQQWLSLPDQVRTQVRAAASRLRLAVRDALELPSRNDLVDLAGRLDDIEKRLATIAARKAAGGSSPALLTADIAEVVAAVEVVEAAESAAAAVAAEVAAVVATEIAVEAAEAADAAEAEVESSSDGEGETATASGTPSKSKKNKKRGVANKTGRR